MTSGKVEFLFVFFGYIAFFTKIEAEAIFTFIDPNSRITSIASMI